MLFDRGLEIGPQRGPRVLADPVEDVHPAQAEQLHAPVLVEAEEELASPILGEELLGEAHVAAELEVIGLSGELARLAEDLGTNR